MSQMNQDTNNGSRKAHTLYITELERQAQEAQDKEPTNEVAQEVAAPKRSFRMAKDDKTVRLLIGFAGVVAVALIMLILFSDKGKPRTKKNADASLGRPKTADTVAPTDNGSVVPQGTMQPMRDDQQQPGQVNANDIENTKKARVGAGETKSAQADVQAKNLGQIPEFPASSNSGDNWAPPPYGQKDSAGTGSAPVQDKAVDGLAKPSLVFTASTEKSSQSAPTDHDIPLLDMGTGSRLAARLASVVTTAVDQPVIASSSTAMNMTDNYRGERGCGMRRISILLPVLTAVLATPIWGAGHAEAAYYADAYARHYHVPPELVRAIIRQESNWNQRAISEKNARGLMQLMPGTAERFGVRNSFDISQNVGGGVRYLRDLLAQYHGDIRLTVAAYYAGEHRIHSLQYSNTDVIRYVEDVRRRYLQELSAKHTSKEFQR